MGQIFFILGQGRSSTALLAQLLARHRKLAIAPESLFILDMQRKYGLGRWDRTRIDAFCNDLERQPGMAAFGLDKSRLAFRLYERESRLTYAEACRQVYTSYAEDSLGRGATSWIGEHNALYALQIEQLERVLPSARYVHVTRDYRDELYDWVQPLARPWSGASRGRHAAVAARSGVHPRLRWPLQRGRVRAWARSCAGLAQPAVLAQRWKEYNLRILELSRSTPERSLWLRHEDLLAYPEHELARVCRFLDLAFDPDSLGERAQLAPGRPHARAGEGGQAHSEPRWQQLPESTLRQLESICGEFAERFGYRMTTRARRGPSLRSRLLALYGSSSVAVERLAVQVLPSGLRMRLMGAYQRFESSLHGGSLPGDAVALGRSATR